MHGAEERESREKRFRARAADKSGRASWGYSYMQPFDLHICAVKNRAAEVCNCVR